MPLFSSVNEVQQALKSGKTTCTDLVRHYLRQIEATAHLNAYVEVWAQEALDLAAETDRRLSQQPDTLGRLFGVVVSVKDNICYEGHMVTAASGILDGFRSLYSATALERLLAEGAIPIGRTNCDQFGMGSSNENSVYGPVLHPMDPERVPGGSSGGAAVSVSTDTCLVAMGSDTGGSIRQPAGFCGVWGLKPAYGRISRHGLIAYGSSFDQIGFLAHHPHDLALLLEVSAGPDAFDATAAPLPAPVTSFLPLEQPLRIAYFPATIHAEAVDKGVQALTLGFLEQLRLQGHMVEATDFPLLDYVIPAYYVLTTAEASANLSRYDGIRYGRRAAGAQTPEEVYLKSRTEGFSPEVKRRILLGAYVLSSGYYEAYYTKAQQVRRLLHDRVQDILQTFDAILMPIAPDVAWRFGEKSDDPTAMYLSDIYTVLANLCGVPAVAFPIGKHPDNGMPVGIQLLGNAYQESALLRQTAHLNSITI
jgi:aspartyl-tRNA(Asn)/glutamyl-tRNA(Gln) amidotransferase subunit A